METVEWLGNIKVNEVITIIIQIFALRFGIKTFNRANIIREETLDWNRKIATEKELSNKPSSKVSHILNEKLNLRNTDTAIDLTVIEEATKDDSTLDGNINHLLNRYDRLARGILLKIYDEEMAKTAIKTIFIKNYVNFSNYINDRRQPKKGREAHPNAFIDFETIANKWKTETH